MPSENDYILASAILTILAATMLAIHTFSQNQNVKHWSLVFSAILWASSGISLIGVWIERERKLKNTC